jgi:hypothetical protein
MHGLASSAFARHYSRNHQCFLFLRVLRCFTSPRSPQHPIHSGAGNPTSLGLGYPIRTSSDHSSVDNSPRHIAASHVLHRLLVPRHPPCALSNLATKMLASTIQFSNNNQQKTHTSVFPQDPTACQQPSHHHNSDEQPVFPLILRAPTTAPHTGTTLRTPHQKTLHKEFSGGSECCSLERR